MGSSRIGHRIGLGFGLAMLGLVLVGWVAWLMFDSMHLETTWVDHTHDVLRSLSDLNLEVTQSESSVRGYVGTGQEAFLIGFSDAQNGILRQVKVLETLLGDDSQQVSRFRRLRPMIDQRMALLNALLEARRKGQLETLPRADEGREVMLRIRGVLAEMRTAEETLLDLRQERAAEALRVAQRAVVAIVLAMAAVLAAFWMLLVRSFTTPLGRLLEGTRRLGEGSLKHRVQVTGQDELSEVATSFNHMAEQLMEDALHRASAEQEIQASHVRLQESLVSLERRTRWNDLVRRMLEVVESSRDRDEALQAIQPFCSRLFEETRGALYLLEGAPDQVERVASWGQPALIESFSAVDCWAIRRGMVHRFEPNQPEPACGHIGLVVAGHNSNGNGNGSAAPSGEASLCLPMMAQGESLGVLCLRPSQQLLSPEWMGMAAEVADRLALAVANLKLRETLRQESIRDPLTGLYNRRFMEESLSRELARMRRGGEPLVVIMLDVDHFKRFNDSFGHDAGDAVLQAVGRFLRERIRTEDVPCRYGGEEFTLILPGSTMEHAIQRAEQLRAGVENLSVSRGQQTLGPVTISLGLAEFSHHGETPEELLQAADAALYRAKQQGRNQAVVAGFSASGEGGSGESAGSLSLHS